MTYRWFVRAYYADDVQPPKEPGGFAIEIGGRTEEALTMDLRILRGRDDIGRIEGPSE